MRESPRFYEIFALILLSYILAKLGFWVLNLITGVNIGWIGLGRIHNLQWKSKNGLVVKAGRVGIGPWGLRLWINDLEIVFLDSSSSSPKNPRRKQFNEEKIWGWMKWIRGRVDIRNITVTKQNIKVSAECVNLEIKSSFNRVNRRNDHVHVGTLLSPPPKHFVTTSLSLSIHNVKLNDFELSNRVNVGVNFNIQNRKLGVNINVDSISLSLEQLKTLKTSSSKQKKTFSGDEKTRSNSNIKERFNQILSFFTQFDFLLGKLKISGLPKGMQLYLHDLSLQLDSLNPKYQFKHFESSSRFDDNQAPTDVQLKTKQVIISSSLITIIHSTSQKEILYIPHFMGTWHPLRLWIVGLVGTFWIGEFDKIVTENKPPPSSPSPSPSPPSQNTMEKSKEDKLQSILEGLDFWGINNMKLAIENPKFRFISSSDPIVLECEKIQAGLSEIKDIDNVPRKQLLLELSELVSKGFVSISSCTFDVLSKRLHLDQAIVKFPNQDIKFQVDLAHGILDSTNKTLVKGIKLSKRSGDHMLEIPQISIDRDSLGFVTATIDTISAEWSINTQFAIAKCIEDILSKDEVLKFIKLKQDINKNHTKQPKNRDLKFKLKTRFSKVKALLPQDEKIMLETNDLEILFSSKKPLSVKSKFVRIYSAHPTIPDAWGRLITVNSLNLTVSKSDIDINSQGIRLNMVNNLVFSKLIDNFNSGIKAARTIMYRAIHNDPKYTIQVHPKSLITKMPRIRVRSKKLMATIEDDVFESKLNLIFEIGLKEQKDRLEREKIFEEKAKKIEPHGKKLARAKIVHSETDLHLSMNSNLSKDDKPSLLRHFSTFNNTINPRKYSQPSIAKSPVTKEPPEKTIPENKARYRLYEYFSNNWIKIINRAEANLKESVAAQLANNPAEDIVDSEILNQERIVGYSKYPYLFFTEVSELDWEIKRPDLDENGLRDFMFNVGKGLPKDSQFELFVPLDNSLKCASLRVQFRDYPLPLLYFPDLHPNQNTNEPAIKIEGIFIIAENYRTAKSNFRKIFIPLDKSAFEHPEFKSGNHANNPYMVQLNKTVTSPKIYSNLKFTLNSTLPCQVTWCVANQPAMQTFMQTLDKISKPPIDPSEKLGFWDKIRAVFHARIDLRNRNGSIQLQIKGSTNPYKLVGDGAGIVMCWKDNVHLVVNGADDPKELIVVGSQEYIVAVPDYSTREPEFLKKNVMKNGGLYCESRLKEKSDFQKVIMKFRSNRVRWVGGLLFERQDENSPTGRTYDFKPHYDVVLSNPHHIKNLETYDAYEGFRSQYLHLAISVTSIASESSKKENNMCYNSIHLTPHFFSHIFKWIGLFDGSQSLPVRTGNLFTTRKVKQKKFGRHLFSIKYQLQLAPLFFTHMYVQKNYNSETNISNYNCTGLKAKVDKFTMDMHQRKEPQQDEKHRWRMGVNAGEIDFLGTDLRVLTATFKGNPKDIPTEVMIYPSDHRNTRRIHSAGQFNIYDDDMSWIDFDDYVELDGNIPSHSSPKITVLQLGSSPRFTYLRHKKDRAPKGMDPFGNEPSHDCLIGKEMITDTQDRLIVDRLKELEDQIETNNKKLKTLKSDYVRHEKVNEKIEKTEKNLKILRQRVDSINKFQRGGKSRDKVQDAMELTAKKIADAMNNKERDPNDDKAFSKDSGNSFVDRFVIHSFQMKWDNEVRNAAFKYLDRVEERRTFSYIMTQKALSYLTDVIENKTKGKKNPVQVYENMGQFQVVEDSIHLARDRYLIKFISPQIQLISDKNPDHCMLLTSDNIELKTIELCDEEDENRIIETRFTSTLKSAQFFVLSKSQVTEGASPLLTSWPPWLPVDCCYDSTPLVSNRVIPKTSVSCVYVKPYSLSLEGSPNIVQVHFPKVTVACDSPQFFAIFTIAMDLLMYTEPVTKERSDRLDKVMLATDFSNLENICLRISELQKLVRLHQDIKMDYVAQISSLDREGLSDLATLELEQTHTLRELFVMMEALKSREQGELIKFSVIADQTILHILRKGRLPFLDVGMANSGFERVQGKEGFNANWVQVEMMQVFNLAPDAEYPEMFAPIGEKESEKIESKRSGRKRRDSKSFFDKFRSSHTAPKKEDHLSVPTLESSSRSVASNSVRSQKSNSSLGTTMTGRSYDSNDKEKEKSSHPDFIHCTWTLLDPIGGIPIVENFEVHLQPVKFQIDSQTWTHLFEFLFPEGDAAPFNLNKPSEDSGEDTSDDSDDEGIHRTNNEEIKNNEIATMQKRAANYHSLIEARLFPTTMSISYHSFALSVDSLVIQLPGITYRNKTWSTMDLILALKRDVTKILLSHTGSLVGNVLKTSNTSKRRSKTRSFFGFDSGKQSNDDGQKKRLGILMEYERFRDVEELEVEEEKKGFLKKMF